MKGGEREGSEGVSSNTTNRKNEKKAFALETQSFAPEEEKGKKAGGPTHCQDIRGSFAGRGLEGYC